MSAPWSRCRRCSTSSTNCLTRVDFLSVGSNDLLQFMFAADRGNADVAERFDPLSAPVLRALKVIVDKARAHDKPVSLCGELASQADRRAGAGGDRLSLAVALAVRVGPVKAMMLELDAPRPARCAAAAGRPAGSVVIREELEALPTPKACSSDCGL